MRKVPADTCTVTAEGYISVKLGAKEDIKEGKSTGVQQANM